MTEERQKIGLFDFSELRRKNEEYNTNSSKNSNGTHMVDFDLDSNQQLMKSFKELRDKLKAANRENQILRQEMSGMQVQIKQLHQSQKNLMTINHQLKQRNQQIQQTSDELKKRIFHLKQQLSQLEILKGEHQFLKGNFLQLKAKNETLEEQKKKVIEISIEDKMCLEERLDKMIFKKQSDEKYQSEIETELSKAKQTILKLQNQVRKLEIKYDEQLFNKKWSKDNFEREHYQKKNHELESQLSELKNRHRKQKEKRADLKKDFCFCNVKAEAYEGEVEIMSRKVKKMQRRISQAKQSANKIAQQKINYEQKFNKSVQICEELINRVKRQLMGDVVELAKTTEYRLNKLKEGKQVDKADFTKTLQRLSNPNKKLKSDKKSRQSVEKQNIIAIKQDYSFKYLDSNSQTGKVLFESDHNQAKKETAKNKNPDNIAQSLSNTNESHELQVQNIELKVRKERQEMEKKLKQKMLYRKIQLSNSPNKGKLRQEYLKLIFQK